MTSATRWACLAIAMFASGCGCEGKAAPAPAEPQPVAPTQTVENAPAAEETSFETVWVYVRVVDLEGRPLAGVTPIATEQPNAFDAPTAQGAPTDVEGRSSFTIPGNLRLCVRAWDPRLEWFANSYQEVLPGSGNATEELELIMAPSASLSARLIAPDGSPAVNANIGLMMFHPTKGPWWPAEGNSDGDGVVRFPHVPPGQFVLRLKTSTGGRLDVPEVALRPGGETDIGVLRLQ